MALSRTKSRLVMAASQATEANQSLLERGVNVAEKLTNFDIDGDGDVGEAGSKKGLSLAEVLRLATLAERNQFFDETRRENEEKESIADRWWLSNPLMYRAVLERNGPTSWEASAVRLLQSRNMQTLLIVLLLLDVLIVFAELFLETEQPSCKVVQRVGFSCCPITAGYRQHVLANATAELAAAATGAYVNVDGHAAHDVGYDEGAAHGVGAAHGAGCEAPSGPSEAFEVGCTLGLGLALGLG